MGNLPKKIQCQETYSSIRPADRVPTTIPKVPIAVITPNTLPRISPGKREVTRAGDIAKSAAFPTACRTLNRITDSIVGDNPIAIIAVV